MVSGSDVSRHDAFRDISLTVATLESLLDDELARGRAQTESLTALDVEATRAYATARAAFTTRLAALEAELATRVGAAASALGLEGFDMNEVCRRFPAPGKRLAGALAQLAEKAAAIRRQDALNHLLAARARACVSGWLRALTGAPAAYDKQGAARAVARVSTSARVV